MTKLIEQINIPPEFKLVSGALPRAQNSVEYTTDTGFRYYYTGSVWYGEKGDLKFTVPARSDIVSFTERWDNVDSRTPETRTDVQEPDMFFESSEQTSAVTLFLAPDGTETPVQLGQRTPEEFVSTIPNEPPPPAGYPAFLKNLKDSHTFLYYLPKGLCGTDASKLGWIVQKVIGTLTDQVSGDHIVAEVADVRERNVYGSDVKCASSTLDKLALVWVRDLQTYISLVDPRYDLASTAEDKYFTSAHVQKELAKDSGRFKRCEITGLLTDEPHTMYDGTVVSSVHYAEHCFTCDDCCEIFPNEMHSAHGMCAECHVPSFEELVRNYQYDAHANHGSFDAKGAHVPYNQGLDKRARYYGLELEMGTDTRKNCSRALRTLAASNIAVACSDGSITVDSGFEIKTPPVHAQAIKEHVGKIFSIMEEEDVELSCNASCGVHIHVSRNSVTELQLGRMFTFVHNSYNRSLIEAIAGRGAGASYANYEMSVSSARRLNRRYKTKTIAGKSERVPEHKFYSSERRQAINTGKEVTVEFRLFAGTIDEQVVLRYIDFIGALLAFTSPGSGNKVMSKHEFLRSINRKQFPDLHKFLVRKGYLKKRDIPTKYRKTA